VKNIQDEYQRYMERVRAKAQSAIDQANTAYSQQRTVLMARFDALVTYLSQQQAAAQQQRQAAAAQQAGAVDGGSAAGAAHASFAKAAAGEGQAAAAAAAAAAGNPMHALSHAMASQLLSLQAGMAAAAGGVSQGGAAAPPAAAPAPAAHHPLSAAFAQFCAMPEAELRAQVRRCAAWLSCAACHVPPRFQCSYLPAPPHPSSPFTHTHAPVAWWRVCLPAAGAHCPLTPAPLAAVCACSWRAWRRW
jgi:hypothetical protein